MTPNLINLCFSEITPDAIRRALAPAFEIVSMIELPAWFAEDFPYGKLVINPAMPPDQIILFADGKMVGRIINIVVPNDGHVAADNQVAPPGTTE